MWLTSLGKEEDYRNLLGEKGHRYVCEIIANSHSEADALETIADFLSNSGLPDEAVRVYETLLSTRTMFPAVHSYLGTLMLRTSPDKYSHKYIYDAAVKLGKTLMSGPPYDRWHDSGSPERRIRVGYVCSYITNSTSLTMLIPILKAHHRDRVEVFMYSDDDPKRTSDKTRTITEHWRDVRGLDDDAFCELVRKDEIDVLLELNGHIELNRYRALTRKPAPIQVSYYNCSATCGVPNIDYALIGEEINIENLQPYYSETIFHKKGVFIGTPVGAHFPPVSPPPFLKNGYITFGSFGQAHKVSREQIHLWCEVLKRVTGSRLYMKSGVLDNPAINAVFAKHFSDGGIDMSRVWLEGASRYSNLLKLYSRMDITLDTYPYGGGTTPMDPDSGCSRHRPNRGTVLLTTCA